MTSVSRRRGPRSRRALTLGVFILHAELVGACAEDFPDLIEAAVVIENDTRDVVELEIQRAVEQPDCDTAVNDPAGTVAVTAFTHERCEKLEPFLAVGLDRGWRALDSTGEPRDTPDAGSAPPRKCDAVLLRAKDLEPVILFWNDVPREEFDRSHRIVPDEQHALFIERLGRRLLVARSALVSVWPAPANLPSSQCEGVP